MKLIDKGIEYSFEIRRVVETKEGLLKSFEYFLSITTEDSESSTVIKNDHYIFEPPVEYELKRESIISKLIQKENVDCIEDASMFVECIQKIESGDKIIRCSFGLTNIE